MARRAEEAENHWPGFVDVLSTIVMVVTFLLIILGIVIFVISKNIAKQALANAEQQARQAVQMEQIKKMRRQVQEQQNRESISAASMSMPAGMSANSPRTEKQRQRQKQKNKSQNSKSASKTKKSASSFQVQLSNELTQNDRIKSKEKLSVRSRLSKDSKKIIIATTEQARKKRKVRVSSSIAVMSLVFKGGVKVTDEASTEIHSFMNANDPDHANSKYEIRAFCNTHKGSISEARRTAYYRALSTRNQLLSLGIKAQNISIKVGDSERREDVDKVNIYLK